jgi:hypothetical protein
LICSYLTAQISSCVISLAAVISIVSMIIPQQASACCQRPATRGTVGSRCWLGRRG